MWALWFASLSPILHEVLNNSFPSSKNTTGVPIAFGRKDTLFQRSELPRKPSNAILQTKVLPIPVKQLRCLTSLKHQLQIPCGVSPGFFIKNDFALLQGQLKQYVSSKKVVRSFCEDCGSHISYSNTDYPDRIEIFVGSFDYSEEFPTEVHTWVSHKSKWVKICDSLPQHKQD